MQQQLLREQNEILDKYKDREVSLYQCTNIPVTVVPRSKRGTFLTLSSQFILLERRDSSFFNVSVYDRFYFHV